MWLHLYNTAGQNGILTRVSLLIRLLMHIEISDCFLSEKSAFVKKIYIPYMYLFIKFSLCTSLIGLQV